MSKKDVIDFLNSVAQVKNDLSEPLDIYRTLEKKYISANDHTMLNDLQKEKRVIFSYLKDFENASLKQVRAYLKEIKESVDLDEVKSFHTPKNIDFIKIAYNKGKWAIKSDKLKDTIEIADVPTAVEYLTQIVARFDPQEAAFSLVHAKNNGKFVVAALPDLPSERDYENATQDASSQFINTYTTKDRGYTMLNQPVSLQADVNMNEVKEEAEEDTVREGNVYMDAEENLYTVSFVDSENAIFTDNQIKPLSELQKLIDTGAWKRQAGNEEKEIQKILTDLGRYKKLIKDYNSKVMALKELEGEYAQKVKDLQKAQTGALEEKIRQAEPKIKEKMKRLQELEVKVGSIDSKTSRVIASLDYASIEYIPERTRTQVASLKKIKEEIMPKYKKMFGPSKQAILDQLLEEMTNEIALKDGLAYNIDTVDPEARAVIDKNKELLRKQIKNSLYSNYNKKQAYQVLDDMLVADIIDFPTYNEFSDYVEHNAEVSYRYLNRIKAAIESGKTPRYLSAGAWDKVKDTVSEMWNKAVSWFEDLFNFTTIELAEADDLDASLDEVLGTAEQGE